MLSKISKRLTVAVLMGGISAEREISLASGREVVKALKASSKYERSECAAKAEYEVRIYDPKKDLVKLIKEKDKIDVVLPVLHGPHGEDGSVQGFLELLKLPYVFSGVLASSLAINKLASRELFKNAGLPVPRYIVSEIAKNSDIGHWDIGYFLGQLGQLEIKNFPLVVKPNTQGSSIGISICHNQTELEKGLKEAFKYDKTVLLEEYIKGREITVGVLGEGKKAIALPVVEIIPKEEFFNLKAKYDGSTTEIVPAQISDELTKKAQEYGRKAHRVLDCSGVTRTDMILQNSEIYVLETNTIPGFTKESLIPKAARAAGMSFEELIARLIKIALEGYASKKP